MPIVGDSIWRLTMYNNLNAIVLFLPFIGEFGELMYFPLLFSPVFWTLMSFSGVIGFLMGYVTGWQIQATSALTHNISGTAKAAAQTVMAVVYFSEVKTFMWSNSIIFLRSVIISGKCKNLLQGSPEFHVGVDKAQSPRLATSTS
ncbi:unnamed protein product [Heligmosomoides polygyrus]|uniref:Sugar phosphate transporter domain-containing protein n=1 Tax=Heligmosomoides polygyrus TaxID=6339 RepID=A0A3P7U9B9_HELPZ|nr:unnamed protein product [Heligmosomoides polygyrus]